MNTVHIYLETGRMLIMDKYKKSAGTIDRLTAMADKPAPRNLGLILFLYLLGIFMGAIDTGIVTPARTLIQGALGVDGKTGIWMITIYTLAYAAVIPISGKLADRLGRKLIYLVSIALFGLGSFICSLSASSGQFWVLLAGRVIQALGGGGIVPIATAEFGTTFPPEKRGMALGLVGGVYGIANILGSSVGSLILSVFGNDRWNLLFLVNVPIAALIVAAGLIFLPNNKGSSTAKIDWAGIPVVIAMVLALLYGLRNIDFFDFSTSIRSVSVYPYLLAFLGLLPILIFVERKSPDPVLNLSYFTSVPTLVTLALGFAVGVMMMGMIFVPQFSENALSIATGAGGYFVAMLGFFAGLSGPLSGGLVDKIGPKKVLLAGFAITLAGALFLIMVAIPHPSYPVVLASLAVIGLGLGFTMGTPLNYMMLQNTKPEDSTSALATLSLVRSIGTAIAPAIMIGFLAHAGVSAQARIMALLPPVQSPRIENAAKVESLLAELKKDPQAAAMLGTMEIPSFGAAAPMKMEMGGSGERLPSDLLAKLQSADVTNIVAVLKELSATMFDAKTPEAINSIRGGISKGIDGISAGLASMDASAFGLAEGIKGMDSALKGMDSGLAGIDAALSRANSPAQIEAIKAQRAALQSQRDALAAKRAQAAGGVAGIAAGRGRLAELKKAMEELDAEIEPAFRTAKLEYLASLESIGPQIQETFRSALNEGFRQMYLTVGAAAILAAIILAFYKPARREELVKANA
jgi:EmrB/QacA subfamily drug resistance transporter